MKKLSGNSADFFLLPPTSNSVFMRKPPYIQWRKNPKYVKLRVKTIYTNFSLFKNRKRKNTKLFDFEFI